MNDQADGFKMAVNQMVQLGNALLTQQVSEFSKLNQCGGDEERREMERLYINEIEATANVIRLFTGREISFQWQSGVHGEFKHGFALYEIAQDAPCDKIPCGVYDTTYDKYGGRQKQRRLIDWGAGVDCGKIVKIYELIYDKNANPCYVGGFISSEHQL